MQPPLAESGIKETLVSLLDAIKNSDGNRVTLEMERLDACVEREGGRLHPQLAHFLGRRSYAKALAFLGGETPDAGACGGRH